MNANEDLLIGRTMESIKLIDNLFAIALACNTKDVPKNEKDLLKEGRDMLVVDLLAANAGRAVAYNDKRFNSKYQKTFKMVAKECLGVDIKAKQ